MTASLVRRCATLLVLATLAIVGSSCAHRYATLEGVVRESRPLAPSELDDLRIERPGKGVLPVSIGMGLKQGDSLVVCERCTVLLKFGKEWQVALAGGSEAVISSIDLKKGLVYVKKLVEKVHGYFRVNYRNTAAIVSGTEFLFSADRSGDVTITVLDGAVTLESRTGAWPPVVYRRLQTGGVRGNRPPTTPAPVSPDAARRDVQWVRQADRLTSRTVPNLLDLTEAEARRELDSSGFVVGAAGTVITGKHAVGVVAWQRPKAGTATRAGTRVSFNVEEPSVVVPDLTGRTLDLARAMASRDSLTVTQGKSIESDAPEGQVVSQTPSAGARVKPGSNVKLDLATTRWCVVPKLVDLQIEEARAALLKAGLRMGEEKFDGGNDLRITSQSVPAGTRVRCGGSVNVTYGRVG